MRPWHTISHVPNTYTKAIYIDMHSNSNRLTTSPPSMLLLNPCLNLGRIGLIDEVVSLTQLR